jgi:hypothetical protein
VYRLLCHAERAQERHDCTLPEKLKAEGQRQWGYSAVYVEEHEIPLHSIM